MADPSHVSTVFLSAKLVAREFFPLPLSKAMISVFTEERERENMASKFFSSSDVVVWI